MKSFLTQCLAVALTALFASAAHSASSIPEDVLFSGSTAADTGRSDSGWCTIESGPSTFQNEKGKLRYIALGKLSYNAGDDYFMLSGHTRMKFKTATEGNVQFDFNGHVPKQDRVLTFSRYKETYSENSGHMKVTFRLHVRDCTVKVKAIYRD